MEQIGKGMGVAATELKLQVIRLMEAKTLRRKRRWHGTKHFAR